MVRRPDETVAVRDRFVSALAKQAEALGELEENTPEEAIQAIKSAGSRRLREFFVKHEAEEHFEEGELIVRLGRTYAPSLRRNTRLGTKRCVKRLRLTRRRRTLRTSRRNCV